MKFKQPKWIKTPRYEPKKIIHISEWKQESIEKQALRVDDEFSEMVKHCEEAGRYLDEHDMKKCESFSDSEWDSFGQGLPDQPEKKSRQEAIKSILKDADKLDW